jgi:hypothetical protein
MHSRTVIALSMIISLFLNSCYMATPPATTSTPIDPNLLFSTSVPGNDLFTTPAPTNPNSQPLSPIWGKLPEGSAYPTPVVNMIGSGQQKYILIEDYRGRHVVETETIPVNNCSGQDVVKVSVTRSKTYSSSIEVGAEITAGIDEIVKFEIATQYNINTGEAKSYEINVEFSASPKTNTVYTIEWAETWIVGRVFPLEGLNRGDMQSVQYFTKSNLQVNIPDSIVQNCVP